MHRPTEFDARCRPLSTPITVESGAVSITCGEESEHGFWFRCAISQSGQGQAVKSGLFAFSDARQASGFDPTEANVYASWDGCSIRLRDGRILEEIEVISSVCDGPRLVEPKR
jgi:hypothetical protein